MRKSRIVALLAAAWAMVYLSPTLASNAAPLGTSPVGSLAPEVEVLTSRLDEVRLRVTMNPTALPSQIDLTAGVDGLWGSLVPEQIGLPRKTFFVAIAHTGTPELEVVSWETVRLPAAQVALTSGIGVGEPLQLGEPAVLREARVVPVTIFPVQYESGATEAEVLQSAEIVIRTGADLGVNPLLNARGRVSRSWIPVYRSVIANWQSIDGLDSPEDPHILIIVPGFFEDQLEEFVTWKERSGFVVTVVRRGDIGTNPSAQDLRDYIIAQYDTLTPTPDYVIFVGNGSHLDAYDRWTDDPYTLFSDYSYAGWYTDENYFVAIEGDDIFPDLFFGRWVAGTTEEVLKIARRSVFHESNPFQVDSLRFLKACMGSDTWPATQAQTKRHVRQMLLNHGFTVVDTLFGIGTPQLFINRVQQGRNFVNYRGPGWSFGWSGLSFYNPDIPFLNNYWKLPIVTGIGCGVAKFDDYPDCFGQIFMTEGTLNQPEGCVGFLGPSWNTHTRFNDVLDSTLYIAILDHEVHELMPAFVAGKLMFWSVFQPYFHHPGVQELTETAIRQYLCLSDPSLRLYTKTPQRLTVIHPAGIPLGEVNLVVNVPNLQPLGIDTVKVCVWVEPGNFIFGFATPQQETVVLPITIPVSCNGVWLTVTGDNVLAYQREIPVAATGEYMVHNRAFLVDSLVGNRNGFVEPGETIAWEEEGLNLGMQDAEDVVAILESDDPRVQVLQSISEFGNVAALDSAVGTPPFEISVSDTCQTQAILGLQIVWHSLNAGPWVSDVYVTVALPEIVLAGIEVTDLNGDTWDRGEVAKVGLQVLNTGNAPLAPTQYVLRVDDPLISVIDSLVDGDAVQPGQILDLGDMAFQMQASLHTPAEHYVSLAIHIFADQGTYQYHGDLVASTTVGMITESDPFSDEQRLYWAYDVADIDYEECPVYDWVEIAPLAGGPGDTIGFTRSDETLARVVPFSYSFYGADFDSLSISTDGWVHPGYTTRTNRRNSTLPNPDDDTDGLVAVLWDDLWQPGETGQVAYYYDDVGDRFIVEWYRIHYYSGSRMETFQLQLLNPESHPTPTGDAAWLLLYQDLTQWGPSQATVGIENCTSTDGITYEYNGVYTQGAITVQSGSTIKFTTTPPVMVAAETKRPVIPTEFYLAQNYPNPFNPETTIEFALPRMSHVTLTVYNLLGQRVATLIDADLFAGVHRVRWNGEGFLGDKVGSGVYIYYTKTDFGSLARKMVLLR